MKIACEQEKAEFSPVTLAITLETWNELDVLYRLCAWSERVADAMGTVLSGDEKDNLQCMLGDIRKELEAFK